MSDDAERALKAIERLQARGEALRRLAYDHTGEGVGWDLLNASQNIRMDVRYLRAYMDPSGVDSLADIDTNREYVGVDPA